MGTMGEENLNTLAREEIPVSSMLLYWPSHLWLYSMLGSLAPLYMVFTFFFFFCSDVGFIRNVSTGLCIHNRTSGRDPYAPPSSCRSGKTYQRTKGYVKIAGDVCTVSNDDKFRPDEIPCRVEYVTCCFSPCTKRNFSIVCKKTIYGS
jgi:hypothetical protein